MSFKHRLNAALARVGYNIVKLPRPWGQVQGRDWVADARRLFGGRSPEVIFDVGANTGQTALELAPTFPEARIFSFEPSPETFAVLQNAVRHFPAVTPVNAALGERAGELDFFANSDSQTSSLLRPADGASGWIPGEMVRSIEVKKVPVMTLDGFCSARQIAGVDVLKLDTQGYEMHVLRGASESLKNGRIQMVCAEVQFVDLYEGQAEFTEAFDHLTQHGLFFIGLYSSAYSAKNRLLWADALFASTALVGDGARDSG